MANSIRIIENKTAIDQLLNRVFTTPVRTGYVEVGDENVCLPIIYKDYQERITNFKVFQDDVFLTGFPKSGTTWCHEMIWLIMHDLDFETAKVLGLHRHCLLELSILYDFKKISLDFVPTNDFIEHIDQLEKPRVIKSHLHWSLLPEEIKNGNNQPKIIHIRRDPKDCCTSHYYQAKLAAGYDGTFEEFCELYLAGRVPYGPYWKYVLSFWNQRHRPNILFIHFEEMVADLRSVIKKVAQFLNKTLADDDIKKLEKHLSFESMKKNSTQTEKLFQDQMIKKYGLNKGGTSFYREGKVGTFKKNMSEDMKARFTTWTNENISRTDFKL